MCRDEILTALCKAICWLRSIIFYLYIHLCTIIKGRDEFLTSSLTLWLIYNKPSIKCCRFFFTDGEGYVLPLKREWCPSSFYFSSWLYFIFLIIIISEIMVIRQLFHIKIFCQNTKNLHFLNRTFIVFFSQIYRVDSLSTLLNCIRNHLIPFKINTKILTGLN